MSATTDERPRRRRPALVRAWVVLLVLLVTAAGGCGLSTNDEPETIKDNVPPDLLDTETAAPDTPIGSTESVKVWFLRTDPLGDTRLVQSDRLVPRPATQVSVLESLINDPPTDLERAGGVSTAIPEDVTLAGQPRLSSSDGVLTVALSDEFYDLQGETARNAFAQIVFTATELPGVRKVQFEQDGEVFNAVNGAGQSRSDPLGRSSYDKLRPTDDTEA
jgi:spore germination protein GerM